MTDVVVVDYGMGNLHSVSKALESVSTSENIIISSEIEKIKNADKIVFPGVGAIKDCMAALSIELKETVVYQIMNKPTLAICVGMQIMANGSEEGNLEGLGWYDTEVVKFNNSDLNSPLPHMGWNSIDILCKNNLFSNLDEAKRFYFLHSYHFKSSFDYTIANSSYCNTFATVLCRENIYGIQCHPEKSHHNGTAILKNFSEI